MIACDHAGVCGGCPWITRPHTEQTQSKIDHLKTLWSSAALPPESLSDVQISTPAHAGLRDRSDLAFRRIEGKPVLGLWDLEHTHIVDIQSCPALSPGLHALFEALRADPLPEPIERASIRLRISPEGEHGVWLDLANVDVKVLLDEQSWLKRWRDQAFVEVGQRRKPVIERDDGSFKLQKRAELRPWFATPLDAERDALLLGPVGGFSQPSLVANRVLVQRVLEQARHTNAAHWLELGSGNGNFTLPLAATGAEVVALERDPLARAGLEQGAEDVGLASSIRVISGDMHRANPALIQHLRRADAVLVDPPRSGLRGTLDALDQVEPDDRPTHVLYVSCFAESLVADGSRLLELGYTPMAIAGVDQFPQTPHCEWVVRWQRDVRN